MCQETRENGFANLGAIREHYEDFHKRRYNTDIVKVPQRPNPDAETPEETVPDGQEFLDNPNKLTRMVPPKACTKDLILMMKLFKDVSCSISLIYQQ